MRGSCVNSSCIRLFRRLFKVLASPPPKRGQSVPGVGSMLSPCWEPPPHALRLRRIAGSCPRTARAEDLAFTSNECEKSHSTCPEGSIRGILSARRRGDCGLTHGCVMSKDTELARGHLFRPCLSSCHQAGPSSHFAQPHVQCVSFTISIAPQGHSCTQIPQPLQ